MKSLDNMTREQKLLLYDLFQEKKRRLKDEKAIYLPNEGQILVHRSKARERWVFSGNGSGKTALSAQEAVWAFEGWNPIREEFTQVPCRIIVVLDHPEKVTDVWVPEIQKWKNLRPDQLRQRGKPYVSQIVGDNGSEILFMFWQQEPTLFESIEADVIIFDEPPPRPLVVALRRGLRKPGRKPWILGVGTPIKSAWLRKEILEPWSKGELSGVECFTYGTKVNQANLAEGYIENFSRSLSEKERRIRLDGEFFDLEGLALAHLFDRMVHVVEPFDWDDSNPCVVVVDPHPSKAHHAVLLGVDRDGYIYYLKELKEKKVAREFARIMKNWYQGYRVVDFVCDSLGKAESTGGEGFKSFVQVLNEEGIRIRTTTYDEKNDEDFISRIQDVLLIPEEANNFGQKIPKLRIVRGNWGIVGDIENVQWVKYRDIDEYKPKLDIQNKDFLACLKYGLATNLTPTKGKAHIYRPVNGPATYGINKKPSTAFFRKKLGFNRRNR
jgi:hypothetical protein